MIRLNVGANTFDILNIGMEQISNIPSYTNNIAAQVIADEYLKENKQKILDSVNEQLLMKLVEDKIVEEIKKIKIEQLTQKK